MLPVTGATSLFAAMIMGFCQCSHCQKRNFRDESEIAGTDSRGDKRGHSLSLLLLSDSPYHFAIFDFATR